VGGRVREGKLYNLFSDLSIALGGSQKEATSMPNVHGVEFNANQSELVKDIIRELLKDGACAVYAVPHMKPNGELRMAATPSDPRPGQQRGVFLRIRPGLQEATIVRPMNAKAGDPLTKLNKFSKPELLETIRIWRTQILPESHSSPVIPGVPAIAGR
jgi:hypothetical protein